MRATGSRRKVWPYLPLNGQFLVGRLLDVDDDLLVHSRSQLEALFVLVLCNSAAQTEEKTDGP